MRMHKCASSFLEEELNSICLLFYGVGVAFIVQGFYKGMMRMLVTVLGIVLTIFLVLRLAPEWNTVLSENTIIYENIERAVDNCKLVLPPQAEGRFLQEGNVVEFVIKAIAYVSMYAVIRSMIKIISWLLLKFVQLPGLHLLNSLAGGVLGCVQGVIALWLIFLIVSLCYGSDWGYSCYCAIQNDAVLRLLYRYNLFLYIW